jgi:hypothetical protein
VDGRILCGWVLVASGDTDSHAAHELEVEEGHDEVDAVEPHAIGQNRRHACLSIASSKAKPRDGVHTST